MVQKVKADQYWFYFDIQKKTNKTNSVSGLVSTFFFLVGKKDPWVCSVHVLLAILPANLTNIPERKWYLLQLHAVIFRYF